VAGEPLGKFYCLDVYKTDFKDRNWMPRGTAKKVRVLEGIPARAESVKPKGICVPQLARRRILGEAAIAEDGSFNVEVPANLPIELQLIDEKGMALRSCGWIWTRDHKHQGCIGCHEDGELTPTNLLAKALAEESVAAYPPPEKRPTVDFLRDVMPIVARKCVACHGKEGSPPRLDGDGTAAGAQEAGDAARQISARKIYETLLARDTPTDVRTLRWKYVDPGRARTSPLVWHVVGANTSRPWDGPAAARPASPIPPGKSETLSANETATLIRWIDLGAAWDGISAPTAIRTTSSR
jgi:hypothetical protein